MFREMAYRCTARVRPSFDVAISRLGNEECAPQLTSRSLSRYAILDKPNLPDPSQRIRGQSFASFHVMARSKRPVPALVTLEREPLVWLGQYAAVDRRGESLAVKELRRQLVQLGYWVAREDEPMPAGTLLATLSVSGAATYRLVQLERGEATRLEAEMSKGWARAPSTAGAPGRANS